MAPGSGGDSRPAVPGVWILTPDLCQTDTPCLAEVVAQWAATSDDPAAAGLRPLRMTALRERIVGRDTCRVRGVDRTFLGHYNFAPEELLFQIDRMFSYPGASESKKPWWIDDWDHERDDAVVVGVEPADDQPWIGVFAAQMLSPRGASGVVALPDQQSFAVLCAGAVYRVSATTPRAWREISSGGTEAPVVVEDLGLVLFLDHTSITAYGRNGLAWHSEQLVWDGLHAVRTDGSALLAEGFDAPANRTIRFAVDLRTGKSQDAPMPASQLRPAAPRR